jgi:hypothetical protein
VTQIAREPDLSRPTVCKFLKTGKYPDPKRGRRGSLEKLRKIVFADLTVILA